MFAKFRAQLISLEQSVSYSYRLANALNPESTCFGMGKFNLIFCVGGWKTLGFPSRAAFVETYTPYLTRPGHVLTIDCYEAHITNLWAV